jgi:hypothetical protein
MQPATEYPRSTDRARGNDKWRAAGPAEEGADTIIMIGNVRLYLRSVVLLAESQYFSDVLRKAHGGTGFFEIQVQYANTHAVWRTLNLMCYQSYMVPPSPDISTPGE